MSDTPNTQNQFEFAVANFSRVHEVLGQFDIVARRDQVYKGKTLAQVFETPEDVAQLRLGRQNLPGYDHFTFKRSRDSLTSAFQNAYAVFLPLDKPNVESILQGNDVRYFVANYIEEKDGYITGVDAKSLVQQKGALRTLASAMPKTWEWESTVCNMAIGGKTYTNVRCSNPDDNGDILIVSETNGSQVIYNPGLDVPIRPYFHFGGNGWKKPVSVIIQDGQVIMDDRDSRFTDEPSRGLYRLDFGPTGYKAVKLDEATFRLSENAKVTQF